MKRLIRRLVSPWVLGAVLVAGVLVLVLAAGGAGQYGDVVAVIVVSGAVFAGLAYTWARFVKDLNEGTNTRTREARLDREVDRALDRRDAEE